MGLIRLEDEVEATLRINDALRLPSHTGCESLRYAGMPSKETFSLAHIDTGKPAVYQLFFPARIGVIEIATDWSDKSKEQIYVLEVSSEYIKLKGKKSSV